MADTLPGETLHCWRVQEISGTIGKPGSVELINHDDDEIRF